MIHLQIINNPPMENAIAVNKNGGTSPVSVVNRAKTPHIRTAVAPTAVARVRDIVDIKAFYKPIETPSWITAGSYALREKTSRTIGSKYSSGLVG